MIERSGTPIAGANMGVDYDLGQTYNYPNTYAPIPLRRDFDYTAADDGAAAGRCKIQF